MKRCYNDYYILQYCDKKDVNDIKFGIVAYYLGCLNFFNYLVYLN